MISTKYGKIEGVDKELCTIYMGVPFAKAPLGELMFKHPVKPDPRDDVLKADHGSANPVQANSFAGTANIDQDCLYMNLFVPKNIETPAPVMVWIYGGSYSHGGAGSDKIGSKDSKDLHYDLECFAVETKTIVISFNYRVNLYGFLNLHYIDPEFDQNNGLYDQIMALQFVHETIEDFGGDRNNITLFGQSAGAACILALMQMEEAKGLFHKVIIQSACIEHFFSEEESHRHSEKYLKILGIRDLDELRSLTPERVIEGNKKYESWLLRTGDVRCGFSPTIDGVTLKQEPKEAVKSCTLPMMIGNVSQEGNLFTSRLKTVFLPFIALLFKLKVKSGDESYRQRASNAVTDHIYIRPQMEIIKDYQGTLWHYEYRYPIPGDPRGCYHACELPVLFSQSSKMGNVDDATSEQVGKEMREIWSRFAYEGDPGWEQGLPGMILPSICR